MEAQVLEIISTGSDLVTIAIGLALYKIDKRILKLEWKSEHEKANS